MTDKPLTDFPDLIDLQKRNGLKFFEGKTHDKACAAFISELAKVLRNDLKQILESVSFFSISMDGSQPRKTGHEKELLFAARPSHYSLNGRLWLRRSGLET